MKHTARQALPLSRPSILFLLGALSVCILLLTAACGTQQSHPTQPPIPVRLPAASQSELETNSAVDVREVNRALTDTEMQDYVGDAACVACHKQVAATYARSNHAHTFHLVSAAADGSFFHASQALTDTHIKYSYRTSIANGKCVITGKNARGEGSIAATYAIGTGRTGVTYLGSDKAGQWLELRLSYFPKAHTWDFTPGQSEGKDLLRAAGRSLSVRDFQQCLGCHGTAIRATAGGADVSHSLMNVGCERCHGPGRTHIIEAAKAAATTAHMKTLTGDREHNGYGMEDLHRASPTRITTICGGCHRAETVVHPLSPTEEPKLARFQGVALARSACYQKSGVLSCLTCHEAHSNANPSRVRNDAICLRCHATHNPKQAAGGAMSPPFQSDSGSVVQGKICPVNPRTGCTDCHMPKTAGIMPYSLFTNHLIKVWPKH